jgi:hypothetical protein
MIRRSQPLARHTVIRCTWKLISATAQSSARPASRGSEQCFAAEAQIVEKFRKLTGSVMARAQQDALVEAVLRLDELADSRAMTKLLRVG